MKNKYIVLTLFVVWIIVCLILFNLCKKEFKQEFKQELKQEIIVEQTITPINLIEVNNKTTFTAYTLSIEENDLSPCIGAGNNNLCELRKEMKICASRDLPLNTLIYIDGFGECVIKDRLNKRYAGTNRIDILMETKKEAIKFGKRELSYVVVR